MLSSRLIFCQFWALILSNLVVYKYKTCKLNKGKLGMSFLATFWLPFIRVTMRLQHFQIRRNISVVRYCFQATFKDSYMEFLQTFIMQILIPSSPLAIFWSNFCNFVLWKEKCGKWFSGQISKNKLKNNGLRKYWKVLFP